jgi:glutamate/aspartate transport system substrate-binding protein
LSDGTADAFASDKLLLAGAQFSDANGLTLLPDDLSFEPYGIALPRGDWALRLAVNTGLAQAYRSGQALEIFKKWFEQIGLRPGDVMRAVYVFGAFPE